MNYRDKNTWNKLFTPKRYPNEIQEINASRSPFLADHDRIVFSSSFRRLAKKTQVHPFSGVDHIHTRLSHSLEVACVGRSLGINFGLWLQQQSLLPYGMAPHHVGEIVEAACLAHDIGNPPFGHAGEEAIRDWFISAENEKYLPPEKFDACQKADFQTFDGNAQGFRVLNTTEIYKDNGGMRLTYPTIAAMVKYPNSAQDAQNKGATKFGYYTAEKKIFEEIFSALGLDLDGRFLRHPLAYLVEAADDICYLMIDMEDAREMNLIQIDDILDVIAPFRDKIGCSKEKLKLVEKQQSIVSERDKAGYIRAKVINHVVDNLSMIFSEKLEDITRRIKPIYHYADNAEQLYFDSARKLFSDKILKHKKKIAVEIGSYSVYSRLLDIFIPAVFKKLTQSRMTYKENRAIDLMTSNAPRDNDDLYQSYLRVVDYISGMTDDYATYISSQFNGMQ